MPPEVYIDVGHSAGSPGAVGFDGRTEHAEGLELAHLLAPRLRAAGITYRMDLSGGDPAVGGSVDRANASGAGIVMELHRDWRGSAADDECFVLHATEAGARVARAIVAGLSAHGLPIFGDGVVDEDAIGRHGLHFLNRTAKPAVILELGKVRDYAASRNASEADGIVAGLAALTGKGVPQAPARSGEHRDVAVAAVRSPDTELAAGIAWAHDFAFVRPLPRGRWLQTYPDGREVIVDSVGYVVAVGFEAEKMVRMVGDGVTVTGPNRHRTAIEAARRIRMRQADRTRPWSS